MSEISGAAPPEAKLPRMPRPCLHLLPNYDEFLIAYKDTAASYDPELFKGIFTRELLLSNHFVVLDGRLIGGWRRSLGKQHVEIEATLAVKLATKERAALEREAQRYADSLGLSAKLTITTRSRKR